MSMPLNKKIISVWTQVGRLIGLQNFAFLEIRGLFPGHLFLFDKILSLRQKEINRMRGLLIKEVSLWHQRKRVF